jgi:hypothetical protein
MPRTLILLLTLASLAAAASGPARSASTSANLSIGVTQSQTITGVSLSNASYTGGAPSGTVVGAISVTMSPSAPAFSGTLSLGGANAASFQIVGSNLETNGAVAAGTYQVSLVAVQSGASGSPFTQDETITGTSPVAGTCPQGTAYVSVGDGCAGAQSTGSGAVISDFFSGYTGKNYGSVRPSWNLPRVDYPVGYAGMLNDPTQAGNLPNCASYSSNVVTVNSTPCTLTHLDATLDGGICFQISASGGTVTFDNIKFGINNAACPWGVINSGSSSVVVQYSEIDDFQSFNGQGFIFGTGSAMVKYSNLLGVSCRLINVNGGGSGSYVVEYNYLEDMGNASSGCHAEITELNTSATVALEQDSWNVFYATGKSCCATAFDYMTSGDPSVGTLTQAIISNNVEITRPTGSGAVTIALPSRIDVTFKNTITNLTVSNNYYDPAGGYNVDLDNSIYLIGSSGGYLTNPGLCSGNYLLANGARITGTASNGTISMTCN